MTSNFRAIGLSVLVAAATLALAQDTWTLKRVVSLGEVAKYKMDADVDFNGMSAKLTGFVTEKVTAVDPDGTYMVESLQTEAKVKFGDQEMDIPETPATKTKFKLNGDVLDLQGGEEATGAAAWRLANLSTFRFPDKTVKVGDEWTVAIPADAKTGAVAATASYKVEGAERIGERDTIKVKSTVKETEGAEAASSDGFVWIDTKDGNMVKAEAAWVNAPFPGAPGPISAKLVLTREG